jgi:uroporphyrinogen-III synthase
LSGAVSAHGGVPVIAPLIRFSPAADQRTLQLAFDRLAAGEFDWLAITSATTVDVLVRHQARVPESTRVAAVGSATRDALAAAGYRTDFVPEASFTAAAMVAEWPQPSGRVLLPQSAIAEPTLAAGLTANGADVTVVAAYQTHSVPLDDTIVDGLHAGRFAAVLLTSASSARSLAAQVTTLPVDTIVACIGPSTATAAREAGLRVQVVAADSTGDGLIEALSHHLIGAKTSTTETKR